MGLCVQEAVSGCVEEMVRWCVAPEKRRNGKWEDGGRNGHPYNPHPKPSRQSSCLAECGADGHYQFVTGAGIRNICPSLALCAAWLFCRADLRDEQLGTGAPAQCGRYATDSFPLPCFREIGSHTGGSRPDVGSTQRSAKDG